MQALNAFRSRACRPCAHDWFSHPLVYARASRHCTRGFASTILPQNDPPFTTDRYAVSRQHFKRADDVDVAFFRQALPRGSVLTAEEDGLESLDGYNVDWLRTVRGSSRIVLRPSCTEDVSVLLSYCNEHNIAVCPQGGNTGLVGGSVPVFDEVVLSMSSMNRIISVDEVSGVLTCEAGCVLEQLDDHLQSFSLRMPLDLGAKGSCQLGGNVSTNAGGLRLLRYGSLHGSIVGAEFVLADGTIVDVLSTMRKDNTGYDLKQLLIGAEGTLGIVTKLAIACPPKPNSETVMLLSCGSYDDVLKLFKRARLGLGDILSAYEFYDHGCVQVVQEHLHQACPLSDPSPFYVLIEACGSDARHDEEKLHTFLERVMEAGLVSGGTIATEPSKIAALWAGRERITEALLHDGYVYKYDISLPLAELYEVVVELRSRLASNKDVLRIVGFGHMGDGNLHLNITTRRYEDRVLAELEPWLWEQIRRMRGSISAEHGIGFKKRAVLSYSKSPESILLMRRLKDVFDPRGILNPYKTIPELSDI